MTLDTSRWNIGLETGTVQINNEQCFGKSRMSIVLYSASVFRDCHKIASQTAPPHPPSSWLKSQVQLFSDTTVVTHSPPTSEVGGSNPGPHVVSSLQYRTLYVLVSSALKTTRRDMTCTMLKATSVIGSYPLWQAKEPQGC